jgi:hypothetical protein
MKTWKTKRTVCRKTKSGRFAKKSKCGQYKRSRVRCCLKTLFHV